ncbi:hypothetical protein L6164_025910 [Bauhinia variegata]|uniref:Uncharacterized protein n=1 Tax=Bauhinia variegata TaxID=167791 RepID=A0ACB9M209_BAUVA|nr:hypothetical protein L6164_025910 [Bauhinia variegata]
MAERVDILHKKLKKLAREVSEQEISQHLFELALESEKASELLSGDTYWRRNGDDAKFDLGDEESEDSGLTSTDELDVWENVEFEDSSLTSTNELDVWARHQD